MRVVPRNDTESWVFREPTVSVFRDVERFSLAPKPRHAKTLFDGDFHMEFCDNLKQLLQAYFRDFSFERLDFSSAPELAYKINPRQNIYGYLVAPFFS